MPIVLNYILIIVFIVGIAAEVYFILKRKGTLLIKGKDDFFAFTLVLLFAIVIFPLSEQNNMLDSIRNILLLVLVMGSMAVKRGFSEKGMEKICYTIAWKDITEVYVNEYQPTKIQVIAKTPWGRQKLIFPKHNIRTLLSIMEKEVPGIYIQQNLEQTLSKTK